MSGRVLLLGVGNPDRRDDGIGPAVVGALAGALPAGATATVAGRDFAQLMTAWQGWSRLVVVDAALGAGLSPGAVRVVDPDRDGPPAPRTDPSGHAFGVAEALALSDALGERPAHVRLVLVGAADLSFGRGLSPALAARFASARAAAGAALATLAARPCPRANGLAVRRS